MEHYAVSRHETASRFCAWSAMSFKSSLTPLAELDLPDPPILEILTEAGITTLEELVGVLESDPEGVGEFLQLCEAEVEDLKHDALSQLDPEVREAFEHQKGKKYPLGALDPDLRRQKP